MSDTVYNTEEEAIEAIKRIEQASEPEAFCPLINRGCVKRCLCYRPRKAYLVMDDDNTLVAKWAISAPYCSNEMFIGKCHV